MPRSSKKRHAQYKIVGLRFSNGKNTVEIGRSFDYKKIRVYLAEDDVWERVEHIADNLFRMRDIAIENGTNSVAFEVEEVRFDNKETNQEDNNGEEAV